MRSSSYSCLLRLNSAMEFSTSLTNSSVGNCSKVHPTHLLFRNCIMKQELIYDDVTFEVCEIDTCKFSRLKISPTARFCFITLIMFSLWSSRYAFTAFGLDRVASCSSFNFIFACSDKTLD